MADEGAADFFGGGDDVTAKDDAHDGDCECVACLKMYKPSDFAGKRPTRYSNHCPKCSLDLRTILKACEDEVDDSSAPEIVPSDDASGGSASTKVFLRKLATANPEEYRKVFAKFKETTGGVVGRGVKKPTFSPKALCFSETTESESCLFWSWSVDRQS